LRGIERTAQLDLLTESKPIKSTEPEREAGGLTVRSLKGRKGMALKQQRFENNRTALRLIENGDFDRAEVFRLYTGQGGLVDAAEGENFLAASHKAFGQYFTPEPVAEFIAKMLAIPAGAWVLDNCCGHGSMFWHLPDGCEIVGTELQDEAWRVARALYPNARIVQDDCLNNLFEETFDYVLINPPFGLHWRTDLNLDLVNGAGSTLSQVACLELAVRAVKPSGYVAAILPEGALKRPDLVAFRRWYRNQAKEVARIKLPDSTFVKVGASAETEVLLLKKLPAPELPLFTYDVLSVGWDETGAPEPSDLGYALSRWRRSPWCPDALEFAGEIRPPSTQAKTPAIEKKLAAKPERRPKKKASRTKQTSEKAKPASSSKGLELRKGRYGLILKPADLVTALKVEEIRQVRCERDNWRKVDEFAELTSLKAFYAEEKSPEFLKLLESFNVEWRYDPGLAHWVAGKRKWFKRQQFVYQTYKQSKDKKKKEAPPEVIDHYPNGYEGYRRKLDYLGLSPFLFEYQQKDAARLACKPFNALLYDMGLGKTRTSIATSLLNGSKRILIVCLSRLLKVWTDELEKLDIQNYAVLKGYRDLGKAARFTLVSYEKLSRLETVSLDPITCPNCKEEFRAERCSCGFRRMKTLVCPVCREKGWKGHSCRTCGYVGRVWKPALYRRLKKIRWGMVIVDESQSIKTKTSLRSQAVAAIQAKRKLLLTGTLIKGYVPDMFWQLHWCFGGGSPGFPYPWWGGSREFISQFATYEYVSEEYGETVKGKKKMVPKVANLPDFWALMGPKVIRRLVDDPEVKRSIQLPKKTVKVVLVEMDEKQRTVYQWWFDNFVEWYRQQLEEEERDANYTIKNAAILGQLWKLRQAATCPHIFAGEDAGPRYDGLLTNKHRMLLEALGDIPVGDKAVIFTGYNPNAELLAKELDTVKLIGSTPISLRNQVIDQFQKEAHPRVLVVGLLAMNLGQTLTRASHALMTDLDWCPSSMIQAEGRLLRISQEQPVNVTYLLTKATIDEDIYELIYQKQKAINEAIDHKGSTEKVHAISIREFVNEMLKRHKRR